MSNPRSVPSTAIYEGREGVKWELGLVYFGAGKMGLGLLGLGFGMGNEVLKNGN